MSETLFINACAREESRTKRLADYYLTNTGKEYTELNLCKELILPMDDEYLKLRNQLSSDGNLDHSMFRYAKQFAEAEELVIAAPYWDLSFPALLKIYLENITVTHITFRYTDTGIEGMCKAKRLVYITTSGGKINEKWDYGFPLLKTLATGFFGIKDVKCYRAENLDVDVDHVEEILQSTMHQMNLDENW